MLLFGNKSKFDKWKRENINNEKIDKEKLSDFDLARTIEAKKIYLNYLKEKNKDTSGVLLTTVCLTISSILIGLMTYINNLYGNISSSSENKSFFQELLISNIDVGEACIIGIAVLIFCSIFIFVVNILTQNSMSYKIALVEIDLNLFLEEEDRRKELKKMT